jgi:hypothetical protein
LSKKIKLDLKSGNKGVLKRFEKVIDAVTDAYIADEAIIFGGIELRKGFFFSKVSKEKKDWQAKGKCYFPECENDSIRYSHTIPKGCLEFIADKNGELIHPYFDNTIGDLSFKKTHLNTASTFPGFCKEHENIFGQFERNKKLTTSNDFMLQCFRTVCREARRNKANLSGMEATLNSFIQTYTTWVEKSLRIELEKYFYDYEAFTFKSFKISFVEEKLEPIRKAIRDLNEYKELLNNSFLGPMIEGFKTGDLSLPICHHDYKIQLPLAMAGKGNFLVERNGSSTNVDFFMNVVPFNNGTSIFILGSDGNRKYIKEYFQNFLSLDPLGIYLMMERWMLNGTDHWFIKPEAWECLSDKKINAIKMHILSDMKNCGEPPDVSVFDAEKKNGFNVVRLNLIKERSRMNENIYRQLIEMLDAEEQKLTP